MEKFNYELELVKTKEAVHRLQGELERQLLGQTRDGWKCGGNRIDFRTIEATKICPPDICIAWETNMWGIRTIDTVEGTPGKYCLLKDFLSGEKIREMFDEYLIGIDFGRIYSEMRARELEERGEKELASKVRNKPL